MPTADGVPGHERDDGLGHGAHVALELEHVETWHPVAPDVSGLASHPLVSSRAERVLAVLGGPVAREEHHAHRRVFAGVAEGFLELGERLGTERIPHFRAVECDAGDPVALVECDVLVLLHHLPIGLRHANTPLPSSSFTATATASATPWRRRWLASRSKGISIRAGPPASNADFIASRSPSASVTRL